MQTQQSNERSTAGVVVAQWIGQDSNVWQGVRYWVGAGYRYTVRRADGVISGY